MKRIARHKFMQNSNMKKVNYTMVDEVGSHKARVYGIEQLPTGEFVEVELGTNKVLIGGFKVFSHLLYNVEPDFTKPEFEQVLYAGSTNDILSTITPTTEGRQEPWVQAFNISYDGAQGDGVVDQPRHDDGWNFEYLIPFRVIPLELNDYPKFKKLYLHHREVSIQGRTYVEYYSKKIAMTAKATFKDGSLVPDNPSLNVKTDLDCRLIAEFPVTLTEEEMVEHWRLRKEEGAEGAHYNSTMLMIGRAAEVSLGGHTYPTMLHTHVYAKSNHVSVAHGVDAFISVKYQLLHV